MNLSEIKHRSFKLISIEGNILKLIDTSNDDEFGQYLQTWIEKDKDSRRKRLEMTKQVQAQNKELIQSQGELEDSRKN